MESIQLRESVPLFLSTHLLCRYARQTMHTFGIVYLNNITKKIIDSKFSEIGPANLLMQSYKVLSF